MFDHYRQVQNAMLGKKLLISLLCVPLLFAGCSSPESASDKPEPVEVPEVQYRITLDRFDQDLYKIRAVTDTLVVTELRREYGEFFEIWLTRLSGVLSPVQKNAAAPTVAANLNQYLSDPYIKEVNSHCDSAFRNMTEVELQLSEAFGRYKVLFPDAKIPRIITYSSPFTSNVMAMDSVLGLGLHFYLGQNYKYYPSLGLPAYMVRRFSPEFIVPDLVKGWLDSEFQNDSNELNCLSLMLYQGKVLYLTEILAPEIPDTLLTGYTNEQLNWTKQNEYRIWTFLIENQVLYNSNPKTYIKFINDGKGTSGFPAEAPSKLGVYTGWQIIRSFMKNNKDITADQLMKLNNAQLLLAKSGYKPKH